MKIMSLSLLVVNRAKWMLMGLVLAVVLLFPHQDATAAGQTPVNLGSAGSFAILAGSAVTCAVGTSTINGDVGVWPQTSISGIPPAILNGTKYEAGPIAAKAQADLGTAIIDAVGRPPIGPNTAEQLGGRTLTPGLYTSGSSFLISGGNLTLDAEGNANAVWIFQMPSSTLTVASGCKVILANGAQARNIFWQVGSSATIATNSVFKGNILASTSITVNSGVTMDGSALAQGGAVTYNGTTITKQPRSTDQPWRILLMD